MRNTILSSRIFSKLFSGAFSVLDTFWFGFVGVTIALNLCGLVLSGGITNLHLAWGATPAKAVSALWSVGCILYTLLIGRAMWRAMRRTNSVSYVNLAGCLLIVAMVGRYGYGLMSTFDPGLAMSKGAVEQEIEAMRLTLPREIEPGVHVTSVRLYGKTYEMTMTLDGAGLVAHGIDLMETDIGPTLCKSYEGMLRGRAVNRVENVYNTDDGTFVTYIDEKPCLAYLDSL